MRVECLAQEHNTISPARARTRTARSGVELTSHEATAPPSKNDILDPYVGRVKLLISKPSPDYFAYIFCFLI